MEFDKKLIHLRIDVIERNLKEIEAISKENQEALSYRDELALKHALLECVEACIDISNHMISVSGFRRPVDYSDVFVVLEENNIIKRNFSHRLQEMAKFRNVLVHRYTMVDRDKLGKIAKEDLKDITEFVKMILKLIK